MHDATTKNHIHIIQSVYRCEITNEDGSKTVVDVPLRFDVCPSGKGKDEAEQLGGHLKTSVNGGKKGTWLKTKSATSDNAARTTNDEIGKVKVEVVDVVRAELNKHIQAHPEDLAPAVEAYLALSPEQREHAAELANLGCSAHCLNLTVDACWNKSEKTTLLANMVRNRAARVIQRVVQFVGARRTWRKWLMSRVQTHVDYTPPTGEYGITHSRRRRHLIFKGYGSEVECPDLDAQLRLLARRPAGNPKGLKATRLGFKATNFVRRPAVPIKGVRYGWEQLQLVPDLVGDAVPDVPGVIRQTSLAFTTGGEHNEYYLNECLALQEWAKQEGKSLKRLPAVRGSRQSVHVQLATAILANAKVYLKYDDMVRIDSDPNKLMCAQWDGLRNRFIVGALRARSLIDVAFCQPMTFFTRHTAVTRPMIRTIMDCAEAWLLDLETLSDDASELPPLQGIAERILAQFPAMQPAYDSWWGAKGAELEAAYAKATEKKDWALACSHLRDAAPYMLATHQRNVDGDASGRPELEHAPTTTDPIESCYGVLDRTLILGASLQAVFGVAAAHLLHAFESAAAKRARAKEAVARRKAHGTGDGSEEE